jgi:hypothetical protein
MWWMAVAGAAVNQISGFIQSQKEQERIKRQKAMEAEAYRYQQQYGSASYNLQREQSREELGIQKNRLAEAMGADMSGYNLALEGQALDVQGARISLADSAGMARAAQGAGGTRGGGGLERRIEYQERAFDRQLDLQQRGNSLSLQNMTRQYTNQFDDIGRELASWDPGGYRYRAKSLSDTYAEQMQGLKMRGYDQAIDDAKYTFGDFLFSGLSGAASGASFGQQLGGLVEQMGGGGGGQGGGGASYSLPSGQNYMPDYNNQLGVNNDLFWKNRNAWYGRGV